MAEQIGRFEVQAERRYCKVYGQFGYFHCWEHYSKPVPAGVISQVFGIVEFDDGVRRIEPFDITFCDEENEHLYILNHGEAKTNADG